MKNVQRPKEEHILDNATKKDLQNLADKNAQCFGHIATELFDIKAMLTVLLALGEADLVQEGATPEEAHRLLQERLKKQQELLGKSFLSSLTQDHVETDGQSEDD